MTRDELASKSNEELLVLYHQTKQQIIKQEIVLRYVYLVKNIALRFRNVYIGFTHLDDIINEGIIALMAAVDKYDPEKNVKFETFVSKRLRGLIVDLARKQDWVPRNVRKDCKEIEQAIQTLIEQLGRYPNSQEVADYLQIDIEKYRKMQEKSNLYHVISLDLLIGEHIGDNGVDAGIDQEGLPEHQFEKKELEEVLREAILSLKPKEQMVISLYYRKELTMKEIAQVMDLSEPRISQIHTHAIQSLRMYLEKHFCS